MYQASIQTVTKDADIGRNQDSLKLLCIYLLAQNRVAQGNRAGSSATWHGIVPG
jgi:hypothetical protein